MSGAARPASITEASGGATDVLANWSPERQIAHMLELCAAQMESALGESDLAVQALVAAFSGLTQTMRAVRDATERLPVEVRQAAGGALDEQIDAIGRQLSSAIVAFQFYDKLTQRLGHVRYSLSTLAMFVCDRSQARQREHWHRLSTSLQRLYRTEEERRIFQMMVEGASAEEAREHTRRSRSTLAAQASGDVELF